MAHDWGNAVPPLEVHPRPEGPQRRGRDDGIPSLHHMTEAERDTQDPDTECRASQVLLEPTEHARALQFLAHAARDDRNERKRGRLPGRGGELFERIVLDILK